MLLTHPERLTAYVDLFIDAPGDEYAPDAGGSFSEAPCWGFSHGELEFVTVGVAGACGDYGSAARRPPVPPECPLSFLFLLLFCL
ncbi:hypothetical protein HYV73_00505 [Candidatus Uhrbacteria bacterium]|nr:hypothetical protein [Candidatus Uhrbacteria bacterium]